MAFAAARLWRDESSRGLARRKRVWTLVIELQYHPPEPVFSKCSLAYIGKRESLVRLRDSRRFRLSLRSFFALLVCAVSAAAQTDTYQGRAVVPSQVMVKLRAPKPGTAASVAQLL